MAETANFEERIKGSVDFICSRERLCVNFTRLINLFTQKMAIHQISHLNEHSTVILVLLLFCSSQVLLTHAQSYQSTFRITDSGKHFLPTHLIEYLGLINGVPNLKRCLEYCNANVLCRTFEYDSMSMACDLYEGLLETGSIQASSSTTSIVGGLLYTANLYSHLGATCDNCDAYRYLQCSNTSLCDCRAHSSFNGAICQNQAYQGQSCSQAMSCRQDLGLECITFSGLCGCGLGYVWNITRCVPGKKRTFQLCYSHFSSSW
jgi:hypothetical protein